MGNKKIIEGLKIGFAILCLSLIWAAFRGTL